MVRLQYARHLGPRAWQKDDAVRAGARARSGEMIGALVPEVHARGVPARRVDAGHVDAGHVDAGHVDAGRSRPAPSRPLPAPSSCELTPAILVGARALIARGWLQGGWYVLQAPDGRRRFVTAGSFTRRSFGEIVQSCLVGAVVESARRHTPEKGAAGPAIDRLWEELGELGAHRPPADPWPPTPVVRSREVGELTAWNDDPARTREDVLHLLDAAIARLAPVPGREPAMPS